MTSYIFKTLPKYKFEIPPALGLQYIHCKMITRSDLVHHIGSKESRFCLYVCVSLHWYGFYCNSYLNSIEIISITFSLVRKFIRFHLVDCFIRGYLKYHIYQVEPTTLEDMKRRIVYTYQNLSATTLNRVEKSFRKRINLYTKADSRGDVLTSNKFRGDSFYILHSV